MRLRGEALPRRLLPGPGRVVYHEYMTLSIQRDPTTEPSTKANRLTWMAWENLWRTAATAKDEKLMARLVGAGLDTPAKRDGAQLVLEEWASNPCFFDNKLLRLLGRGGVQFPDHLVAGLCACGDKIIEMMQKQDVDLKATNPIGENGLALACLINNDAQFERAWRILRGAGVDPHALDGSLENAMDAAVRLGKIDLVEKIEDILEAEQRAKDLDAGTPRSSGPSGRVRL